MKKFNIAVLLLLFAGMYSLVAQDAAENAVDDATAQDASANEETVEAAPEEAKMEGGTITLKLTPSAEARGVLNFAGEEQAKGNTVATDGDAEGRIKVEADYNGVAGVVVELEGDFNKAVENTATVGFGDNAYIYLHALEALGLMDKSVFDVYLQGGRFEAGFQNAQHAGDDDWLKDVDPLKRDNRINMQLDLKILDMLTVRAGVSFAPFDDNDYGNDLGFGILFDKTFGQHKLMASLGYVVNSTNNIASYPNAAGNYPTASPGNDLATGKNDFDQIALSLAYQGTFGQIVLMPFFNTRIAGLINKPERAAYENSEISWNGGVKFSFKDAANSYDMIGVGVDVDGILNRTNNNYYNVDPTNPGVSVDLREVSTDKDMNKAFQGVQVKVWSDALKSIMGDRYLSFWASVRLETWVPGRDAFGTAAAQASTGDVVRESLFKKFKIGAEQRFVNMDNATLSMFAEFALENVAPFTIDQAGIGYFKDDLSAASTDIAASLEFGLKASFTGILTKEIK